MQERFREDTNRLLTVLERGQLDQAGFMSVCVDGPNRDQTLRPYLTAGLYPSEPVYRTFGLTEEANGIEGVQIRNKILDYKIREDFLQKHRTFLNEHISDEIRTSSYGQAISYELARMTAERNGLPISFFLFSKYISDGAETAHLWFPKHLMPDEILEKIQQQIQNRDV